MACNSARTRAPDYRDWFVGALIAAAACVLYLDVCPPLYDIDGYPDRLEAIGPDAWYSFQPHHLLWQPIQIALLAVSAALGHPNTYPFQLFGILINCATLWLLLVLLSRCSENRVFAAAATTFVAFSPEFWYLGFQNRPYTSMFLGLVALMMVWRTDDGRPPPTPRLAAAGVIVLLIILLQQAAIFFVPAAAIALFIHDSRPLAKRVIRIVVWCAAIAAIVLAVYLIVWKTNADQGTSFSRWITEYKQEEHGYGLIDFGLAKEFAKTGIGLSGALVQFDQIQNYLNDHYSQNAVLFLFGVLGLVVCAAAIAAIRRARLWRPIVRFFQNNSLFALAALSLLFWSTFVFVWETATSHFWAPAIFLALPCLAMLLREREWTLPRSLLAGVALLVIWNAYFNVAYDRSYSRNFPELLVKSIDRNLGPKDVFIVLGHNSWYGGMDYDLLYQALTHEDRNPEVAILDDFVMQPADSQSWQQRLRARIESTLSSGGRVFLADHVLDADSFEDLDGTRDPFAPFVNKHYEGVDAGKLQQEIEHFFDGYDLNDSSFAIGHDKYLRVERKTPGHS